MQFEYKITNDKICINIENKYKRKEGHYSMERHAQKVI